MLIILFAVFTVSEFKISHLNALLRFKDPNSSQNPHFTLSAEGGCVNWTSLNKQIVIVKPNYESLMCSKSALVEVVATGPNRKSTSIVAEDTTGQSLKCDIFVDSVASVSILTTTRSIYIDSSFETLYLQALDSSNNIFTSLEGTNINWQIDNEHIQVVDPLKAKVTSQTSSSISHPKSSAQLIIKGINVGKTWASATLDNNLYSRVDLTVVEPISLFPQPKVRVLPFVHIQYKLCSIRGALENDNKRSCTSQISLPDERNYQITMSDQNVATTDQSAYVTVHSVGETTITAIDQNMNDNTASSLIIASYPYRVEQPEQYIALGDDPVFKPKLFDRNNIEYNYTEQVKWEIIGDWSTIGRKEVTLKYHDFSFIAVVYVCPPLDVNPKKAILPINYKDFDLHVSGGSGQYYEKIDNPDIFDFKDGKVRTYNYGKSIIIFKDKKIDKFTVAAEIEVSRVGKIDINLEYRETLDEPFKPSCEVFATDNKKFSVDMPYKYQSSNEAIVSNDMYPKNPGFAEVYCVSGDAQSEHLTVGVASKLRTEVDGIASPDSLIPLKITGGVSRWPYTDDDPTLQIECPGTNTRVFTSNQFSVDREYSGICNVKMQNNQTSRNPHPLLVEAKLDLRIHKVDRFAMHFTDLSNQETINPKCDYPPMRIFDERRTKDNYNIVLNRQYKISIFAIDSENNLIKYYSADRFSLQSNPPQNIIENKRQNDKTTDLSTQYLISPDHATSIKIVPLINPETKANSLNLNTLANFSVKYDNLAYYHSDRKYEYPIEGGSGLFEVNTRDAYVIGSQLFLNANSPRHYKIGIKDVCNPYYTKNIDINLTSVESLQIIAPTTVAFNTEFEATVKAFNKYFEPIPQSMYEEAGIRISNINAKRINYNTYRLNSSINKKLIITAVADNGVSKTHEVNVVMSIVVEPQYIELLQGETQTVTVVSGPKTNLSFNDGFSKVASFNPQTYEVVAISPGYNIINVTSRDIKELPPFPIYVHVIKPINLTITPSSDHIVQYGKLMLSLVMNTDKGPRFINNAEWNIPNDFEYEMINKSLVVIHCSEAKDLHVTVNAYGLSASYSISIEPKLTLKSPQQIYLPTQCSYKILIENDLDCHFDSLNKAIITVDPNGRGIIHSNEHEGAVIVIVKFRHQFLTVNIKVSNPRQFYISQAKSNFDYEFFVLNSDGLQYTTDECLNYELTAFGTDSNDENNKAKRVQSQDGQIFSIQNIQHSLDQPVKLIGTISNQQFCLRNTFYISTSNSITPKNPIFLKGYGNQMKCSSLQPKWNIYDTSIASVTKSGFVNTKKVGTTQITCGNGVYTSIKVLDITNIKIQKQSVDEIDKTIEYKIDFVLSDSSLMSSHPNIIVPNDISIKCELDYNAQAYRCADVSYVKKNGEHYCIFRQYKNKKCPRKANILVTASIPSLGIQFDAKSPIQVFELKSDESDESESENRIIRVSVSNDNPTVEVPTNMKSETTEIRSTYGISAHIADFSGVVVITAEKDFGPSGEVVLIDSTTGEKVIINVIGNRQNSRSSLFKLRQLKLSESVTYIITTLLIIIGIISFISYFCYY